MKILRKSLFIALVQIILSVTAIAQTIESYTYELPDKYLESGGKIYVQELIDTSGVNPEFGQQYANAIRSALNNETIGKSSAKVYNPWLTTKIYEIVDSIDKADYVLKGEYNFTKEYSKSNVKKTITENKGYPKLPINYYVYTEESSASLTGSANFIKKGDTEPSLFLPLNSEDSKKKSKALSMPGVKLPEAFMEELSKNIISKNKNTLTPKLVPFKYRFKNIQTKDKAFKKELRKKEKLIKSFAKTGNITEMGKLYLEILANEESQKAHENVGMCYELIGNFTSAEGHYVTADDRSSIKRISSLIKVKETLQNMGIEVVENEL